MGINVVPPRKPASYKGEVPWEEICAMEEELCRRSRTWLFERHCVIKNKQGALQLMSPLTYAQRKVMAMIELLRGSKQPVRIIIAKSRKRGLSTFVAADMLASVLFEGLDGLIITHEVDLSEKLFQIATRFFENLDKPWTPDIPPLSRPKLYKGVTNKRELRFQSAEGHIWVETAGSKYAGTGQTPQYILASEQSKWEKGADVAISLFQAIATMPNTTMIIESTFNGHDGLFLPYWEDAYQNCRVWFTEEKDQFGSQKLVAHYEVTNPVKWNHFVPVFISIKDDEDAWLEFKDQNEKENFRNSLSVREKYYHEDQGASLELLNWRRMQLKLTCQGNEDIFAQEYPMTPEEGVRASGRSRFDHAAIDRMPIEDGIKGELYYSGRWDKAILFRNDPKGDLTRYREPMHGHRYVVAIDTAEGKLDAHGRAQDDSVIDVYDCDNQMEQVAQLAAPIAVENLKSPAMLIAEYYNNAFIIPECNSSGRMLCIELGREYPRERLYHRDDWDTDKTRMNREIGFRTTVGNKESILIGGLAEAISNNEIVFHSKKTVSQLRTFIKKPGGGTEAEAGYHDDCLKQGTLIKTNIGYRPIENIRPGDMVMTHMGRYKPVEKCIEKPFSGDFYEFRFMGQLPIELSYNHPLLAYPKTVDGVSMWKSHRSLWVVPGDWKKTSFSCASVIDGRENYPLEIDAITESQFKYKNRGPVKLKTIPLDRDFAEFLGRFLADGCASKSKNNGWKNTSGYRIELSFNKTDILGIKKYSQYLESIGASIRLDRRGKNCVAIAANSKLLHYALRLCYDENKEKILPPYFTQLSNYWDSILNEWLAGDGWYRAGQNHIIGCTTSKSLALDMRDISWVYGKYATLQEVTRHRYNKKSKNQYWVAIHDKWPGFSRQRRLSGMHFGSNARKIRKYHYNGKVYNLQVKEDRSFVANGIIVHNCVMTGAMAVLGAKVYPQLRRLKENRIFQQHVQTKTNATRNECTGY